MTLLNELYQEREPHSPGKSDESSKWEGVRRGRHHGIGSVIGLEGTENPFFNS